MSAASPILGRREFIIVEHRTANPRFTISKYETHCVISHIAVRNVYPGVVYGEQTHEKLVDLNIGDIESCGVRYVHCLSYGL